jgi:transposase InsO family protein
MNEHGIRSIVNRKFRVTTTDSNHDHPVFANRLDRDFAATAPDQKWAADITYVPTGEGFVYLAGVVDLLRCCPSAISDPPARRVGIEGVRIAPPVRSPK